MVFTLTMVFLILKITKIIFRVNCGLFSIRIEIEEFSLSMISVIFLLKWQTEAQKSKFKIL